MTFLLDNNISPKLAEILRQLNVDAKALREEFKEDIKDVDLFPQLAERGWILVTCGTHIQTRPVEAAVFKASGVTVVFLDRFFEKTKLWDQAVWLLRYWHEIEKFATSVRPGTSGRVRPRGRVEFL